MNSIRRLRIKNDEHIYSEPGDLSSQITDIY
uniref:Uncharacterized protein n=1 Tax=Trichinella nativa TaxID=6335 RepID=A0A0V1KJ41_9BILA